VVRGVVAVALVPVVLVVVSVETIQVWVESVVGELMDPLEWPITILKIFIKTFLVLFLFNSKKRQIKKYEMKKQVILSFVFNRYKFISKLIWLID
jgi:hypothetical protein